MCIHSHVIIESILLECTGYHPRVPVLMLLLVFRTPGKHSMASYVQCTRGRASFTLRIGVANNPLHHAALFPATRVTQHGQSLMVDASRNTILLRLRDLPMIINIVPASHQRIYRLFLQQTHWQRLNIITRDVVLHVSQTLTVCNLIQLHSMLQNTVCICSVSYCYV